MGLSGVYDRSVRVWYALAWRGEEGRRRGTRFMRLLAGLLGMPEKLMTGRVAAAMKCVFSRS
jgi:hypothetical protein